ncbi:tetratricopeptide repeat protein [Mesorhizobium shangrilense]|uniref:Tetratricopeptide repeat protein n=1 Tax=Mesorhizobium shangrilense TaxID=460060 RepID=A0ABV2DG29_9HYPH
MDTTHEIDLEPEKYLVVSYAEAWKELEFLLLDPRFHCSDRNKRFLRCVSEELFAGRESALKAYCIAVDVFGRPSSFDASTDPIVRIEATRLRSALTHYYESSGRDRDISIELPKGRYVPVFSRQARDTSERCDRPGIMQFHAGETAATGAVPRRGVGPNTITLLKLGLGMVLCGGIVLFANYPLSSPVHTAISERPSLSVDLMPDDPQDLGAIVLRDTLISALSGFGTLHLLAPDTYTSSTIEDASAAPLRSRYRLVLKYSSDRIQRSVWWQVIDEQTGEALESNRDSVRVDAASSIDPTELLVSRLAARIASGDGVIDAVEASQDLKHPTLGNGCVLRANRALSTRSAQALRQARSCLERTLQHRPYDADTHAMLALVLLSIDPEGASKDVTAAAEEHADRAVALGPQSSRSLMAKMMAEFRAGNREAAISAGRSAMTLNPYDTKLVATFARILYSTGERNEAAMLASKALEIDRPL